MIDQWVALILDHFEQSRAGMTADCDVKMDSNTDCQKTNKCNSKTRDIANRLLLFPLICTISYTT